MAGVLADSVSQHDVVVAAAALAADLGTYSRSPPMPPYPFIFWFTGLIPDFATMRDKRPNTVAGKIFGMLAMELAWIGSALGAISEGVSVARRPLDAAGDFGPFCRKFRFRRGDSARLAHHDFSAVLCRRRDLFGLRDGVDARDSGAQLVSPGRPDHHASYRVHGQGNAGYRIDRRLRIRDGSVHGMVFGRSV